MVSHGTDKGLKMVLVWYLETESCFLYIGKDFFYENLGGLLMLVDSPSEAIIEVIFQFPEA